MKLPIVKAIGGAILVLAAVVSLSFAAPTKVDGLKANAAAADEIVSRMGQWDATDVDDLAKADKIVVFSISSGIYESDDVQKIVDAEGDARLTAMHKALAANADVAKWFKDNGYDINDTRAIIHHRDTNTFDIYLH